MRVQLTNTIILQKTRCELIWKQFKLLVLKNFRDVLYIYPCMVDKRWLVIFKSIYIVFRWVKQRSQVKFWGKYFIFDVKKRKMFKYFKVLNDSATLTVLRKASTVFLRWGASLYIQLDYSRYSTCHGLTSMIWWTIQPISLSCTS